MTRVMITVFIPRDTLVSWGPLGGKRLAGVRKCDRAQEFFEARVPRTKL